MFCPFYFQIGLCDPIAQYILNYDETDDNIELEENINPPRFTVKLDSSLLGQSVKLSE